MVAPPAITPWHTPAGIFLTLPLALHTYPPPTAPFPAQAVVALVVTVPTQSALRRSSLVADPRGPFRTLFRHGFF